MRYSPNRRSGLPRKSNLRGLLGSQRHLKNLEGVLVSKDFKLIVGSLTTLERKHQ